MSVNGLAPGSSLPELPALDVGAAVSRNEVQSSSVDMPPLTPLGALAGPTVTPGALPLLVRMPDGERRQIELPPTATVRDLKSSISAALSPDMNWDLDFAGERLNDSSTLAEYNIPDAYDHAGGLLKMISDSGGSLGPNQKVEALDKACAVVAGISRGEKDMERLINAALDEPSDAHHRPSSPTQPTLRASRNRKRSFPSLNLSNLPPPGSLASADKGNTPLAPPTPSQLIRKLSVTRPDLYPPNTATKMMMDVGNGVKSETQPAGPSAGATNVNTAAPATNGGANTANAAQDPNHNSSNANTALFPYGAGTTASSQMPTASYTGDLKRGNTWFEDVVKSFAPTLTGAVPQPSEDTDGNVEGDSEDEPVPTTSHNSDHTDHQSTPTSMNNDDESQQNVSAQAETSAPQGDTSSAQKPSSERPSSYDTPNTAASHRPTNGRSAASRSGVDDSPTDDHARANKAKAIVDAAGAAAAGNTRPPGTEGAENPPGNAQNDAQRGQQQARASGQNQPVKVPKKRGRKRKNPELSEEERKALRQAQNRASAKQSRIRRKTMAAEYEKRVNTLEGENEHLRDTVAALSDRLQFLQTLLTVSVKRPPGQM